jgi:hypothetical protein
VELFQTFKESKLQMAKTPRSSQQQQNDQSKKKIKPGDRVRFKLKHLMNGSFGIVIEVIEDKKKKE